MNLVSFALRRPISLLTNYYEYHFLYITGIEHVESVRHQRL